MVEWTELALTLGSWGGRPLAREVQARVGGELARWAARAGVRVRLERYAGSALERKALHDALEAAEGEAPLELVVRSEPRSDRLAALAALGVRQVVFPVPVGDAAALERFPGAGVRRVPDRAGEMARLCLLAGITPELELVDICRAEPGTVRAVVETVEREAQSRGGAVRWRLVDPLGLADPLPGARLPASPAAWVRFFERELAVAPRRIAFQASDHSGLALAATLAACAAGAEGAASLFGLGAGAGWAASELLAHHRLGPEVRLKRLTRLRELLDPAGERLGPRRPGSGPRAWEVEGDTVPEALEQRREARVGLDTVHRFGRSPEPLLTALSGHAGVLHLLHRAFPERHFPSDDSRIRAVSEAMEAEFAAGRSQPFAWPELRDRLQEAGVL